LYISYQIQGQLMGSFFENIKRVKIWQTTIVYLGGVWALIEALDFISRKYDVSSKLVDISGLLFLIGLPVLIINNYLSINSEVKHSTLKKTLLYTIFLIFGVIGSYYVYERKPGIQYHALIVDNSIAVLTFDNFSTEKENKYLAAGISEAIRNDLGQIENLKVISRNSIEQFQKLELTTPQIGSKLGVKYVLDGSIQKFKERVKINIVLLDAEKDTQVWSKSYEENYDDLLTIQRNIAADVSNRLSFTVVSTRAPLSGVKNIEAYELYLKGMERVRIPSGTRNELKNTLQLFDEVIEIDPEFAGAYLGKAQAYLNNVAFGRSAFKDVKDKTIELIMKAMELDNGISECYSSLGQVYYQSLNLDKASDYFNKAIRLNPNNVTAYVGLGEIYFLNDNMDEFRRFYDYAISLDPLILKYKVDKLGILNFVKRDEKYITELEKIVNDTQNDYAVWSLGMMYAVNKRYNESIKTLLSRKVKGASTNWVLGYAYGLNGEKEKAVEILKYNLTKGEQTYVPPFMTSILYLGLGDFDSALDWLEKEYEEGPGYFTIYSLKADPKFTPLEETPRFKALLEKMPFSRV